jgi:hypothetical protein
MGRDLPEGNEPHESLAAEPPRFDEGPRSVLTPMGQVDSIGRFARGLGARRTKNALAAGGALLLILAFLAAIR